MGPAGPLQIELQGPGIIKKLLQEILKYFKVTPKSVKLKSYTVNFPIKIVKMQKIGLNQRFIEKAR